MEGTQMNYRNRTATCLLSALLLLLFVLLFAGCAASGEGVDRLAKYAALDRTNVKARVGLALGVSGLGDQSFNDMQYNGLIKAYENYPIHAAFRIPASNKDKDLEKVFLELINDEKCRLIIVAEAYVMTKVVIRLAKRFPDVFFVLMESGVDQYDNIASTEFAQNEGSYVVGVLAALMSKSGHVAFLGGVDIGPIKDFLAGFRQGLQSVKPDIKLTVDYVSRQPDFSGFNSPKRGYKMAKKIYAGGADVLYAVAGGTGNGIIQAARDSKKFVIGVDSNQDHMAPGYVLTSMMKRVDIAVTNMIGRFIENNLSGKRIYRFGYNNYGVSLSPMEYTRMKIPERVLQRVKRTEQQISSGTIQVINTLKKQGK